MLLRIENLNVKIDDKKILFNYNLDINKGEIHAIMGPNGCGKSTLSRVIMGDNNYQLIKGKIYFNDEDITKLSVDERAHLGLFLAFQSPIEIEGVSNSDFLRTALSIKEKKNINLYDFAKEIETITNDLKMEKGIIHRSLNQGFSGGEKKKNEILQMKMLKPKMIILDEIDSGLDIDSLKVVAKNILKYKQENKDVSLLIITHYHRILDYIKPDFVHIMNNGSIIKTGDYNLSLTIENEGYNNINERKIV
ncbi:MAG: Fe-S cluster assembly ATPase SufC [Bacilli bacterium]